MTGLSLLTAVKRTRTATRSYYTPNGGYAPFGIRGGPRRACAGLAIWLVCASVVAGRIGPADDGVIRMAYEHLSAASTLHTQSNYAGAEAEYVECIRILDNANDAGLLTLAINGLGVLYTDQGRFAEAEKALERALSLHSATSGHSDVTSAIYVNNLAEVYRQSGRWSQAETLYRRALRFFDSRPAAYAAEHAAVLSNLGLLYTEWRKPGRGAPILEKALGILRQQAVPDYAKLNHVLNNLARSRAALDRTGEARELVEQALDIAERHLGLGHPSTAATLNNLASALQDEGDYSRAKDLYHRALRIWNATLGPENGLSGQALGNLAAASFRLRQFTEAEDFYRRALPLLTKSYGPGHTTTLRTSAGFALLLRKTGRKQEAVAIERDASARLERQRREDPGAATIDINDMRHSR